MSQRIQSPPTSWSRTKGFRRWAVYIQPRSTLAGARELGRFWTLRGAKKVLQRNVLDPLLGAGYIFFLVDLHQASVELQVAQVGRWDSLHEVSAGPKCFPVG